MTPEQFEVLKHIDRTVTGIYFAVLGLLLLAIWRWISDDK